MSGFGLALHWRTGTLVEGRTVLCLTGHSGKLAYGYLGSGFSGFMSSTGVHGGGIQIGEGLFRSSSTNEKPNKQTPDRHKTAHELPSSHLACRSPPLSTSLPPPGGHVPEKCQSVRAPSIDLRYRPWKPTRITQLATCHAAYLNSMVSSGFGEFWIR